MVQNQSGRWGYRNSGVAVPGELAERTGPGDLVLDPMCGSGTTAAACLQLGRRFIVIDQEPAAIEVTWERIQLQILRGDYKRVIKPCGERVGVHRVVWQSWLPAPDWDNGDSYVVLGDMLDVCKTIPDGTVDLVYMDPPFASQRDYEGKRGGFSDTWEWDDEAEENWQRLLGHIPPLWKDQVHVGKKGQRTHITSGIALGWTADEYIRYVQREYLG